ncbi:hypothetical protein [Niabella beijingensis]|uniref:hypothetical protein n=1 Tax=Niabella beijingensis TaxID=2872700 RepID=UPI001CBC059E|nr:hypothetical protein [Niabella beijingensis]MBZ4187634.1 hypothetical protein [Niabella beijingensis]
MKKCALLFAVILLFTGFAGAQSYESDSATRRIQKKSPVSGSGPYTDVITLNACSPDLRSIYIERYNSGRKKLFKQQRFSVNVNRSTSFRIININPLRYGFKINNQLVTQFFDAQEVVSQAALRDTSIVPASSIEALVIFDLKKVATADNKMMTLARSRKEIGENKAIFDSLVDEWNKVVNYASRMNLKYDKEGRIFSDSGRKFDSIKLDSLNQRITELEELYFKQSRKMAVLFKDYEPLFKEYDNVSVLNNTVIVCDNYKEIPGLKTTAASIKGIAANTIEKIKEIEGKEKGKESESPNLNADVFVDEQYSNVQKIYEGKIAQLSEKEQFVLIASMEIGRLLQNKLIEYSRFLNQLKDFDCINDTEGDIKKKNVEATNVFQFIQDVCVNLNTYINQYQLSNTVFDSVVFRVNNNYRTLLNVLNALDKINKSTEVVYTLPFNNNLGNADKIRYTVSRFDLNTKGKEPDVQPYDIWLKGGLKVDFSVAILASGISNFTYNKLALYDSAGTRTLGDTIALTKVDAGRYSFAFGGMVNLLWRTGTCWFTPGFSVGVAYGTNQNLQVLSSLSLQFGKTERLIVHFGFSGGPANYLDLSQYSLVDKKTDQGLADDLYKIRGSMENTKIAYHQRFVFKPFFGISYNLSKRNPLNAVGNLTKAYDGSFPQ